jgi:hypothetical protein
MVGAGRQLTLKLTDNGSEAPAEALPAGSIESITEVPNA